MLHTQEEIKIVAVHSIAWHFLGIKTLLELNYSEMFTKRAWTRLSISFEKFKISQQEQEIQLSKL